MTLILSALTSDAVIQVSDRRFVFLRPDGTVHRADDFSNKSVLFAHRVAFAFTGLAELGPMRQKTDVWMAEILNAADGQAEAAQALAVSASGRFRHPLIRRLPAIFKRQEFVGVGWARFPPELSAYEPYLVVVSNVSADSPERFGVQLERLGRRNCLIHSAGQRLDKSAGEMLRRAANTFSGGSTSVLALADTMISCVRSVAERNQMVGTGVMVTSFPRAAVEAGGDEQIMIASGPMDDVATFLTIAPDANDHVIYGPIAVSGGGGAILASYEARPL